MQADLGYDGHGAGLGVACAPRAGGEDGGVGEGVGGQRAVAERIELPGSGLHVAPIRVGEEPAEPAPAQQAR